MAGALALALSPRPAAAKRGAFRASAHGRPDTGVQRVPGIARGECAHCHGSPRDASGERRDGGGHMQLFAPEGNALCVACHARTAGSWLGASRYEASAHGAGAGVVWPGPRPRARDSRDEGRCVNCHDPHGVKDARGLVPSLLAVRGAALCLGCHSGSPGSDVASAFAKPYRHPLLPAAGTGDAPAGVTTATRGAGARPVRALAAASSADAADDGSCAACHNPHAAERAAGAAPGTAGALAGVSRARVSSAAPGAPPLQSLAGPDDARPVREHEVCLKCHAASAAVPARTVAVAAALNPANASYHPVLAPARDRALDRRAFVAGWGPDRLVACSDCHGTDGGVTRGPHGSSFPHLLKARFATRVQEGPALETDLCFGCHAFATYGDPGARDAAALSRFPGHASHAARGYGCGWCHEPHGSADRPALLALRSPGLVAYDQTASGGSCTATCHVQTRGAALYQSKRPR